MTVEELSAQIEEVGSTKRGSMDTKTLVVGQDVYMVSGWYENAGKVVKVTPSVVEVQVGVNLLRFNNEGKACDSEGKAYHEWDAFSSWATFEGGPWELDDTHPEELATFLECRAKEKARKK